MADYYELLGVDRGATPEDLKRAYRRLARELHPDTNPDPTAEERFKEIGLAYEVLADPERRRRYDTFGPEGAARGNGGDPFAGFGSGGLGDIFDAFFGGGGGGGGFGGGRGGQAGGPPAGPDMEMAVEISFEEAVFGVTREVELRAPVHCDTCEATGAAPGTAPVTCAECQGAGQVRRVRQSILGQMVTAGPCPRCGGLGKTVSDPCPDCRGEGRRTGERSYSVDIPAGIDEGNTLRLSGRGAAGPLGGPNGDLYVHVRVRPHDRFTRDGLDLVHELHLPVTQAALGVHIAFETLDGVEDLVVPAGTQTGRVFRLRGRGVPRVDGRARGDVLVEVVVDTPTPLNRDEEELLRQLASLRGEDVAPADAGLLSRIRSAFK
ncbi:MAG: molecular chaperone DnaJ [Acidimicrobiales bacterium]